MKRYCVSKRVERLNNGSTSSFMQVIDSGTRKVIIEKPTIFNRDDIYLICAGLNKDHEAYNEQVMEFIRN